MSWLENRRKKRKERQRDEEYVSQVGSYNKTLQELAHCENAIQDARNVRDRESEDRFRNELGILKGKRESLKDELGLEKPAELELLYTSREITVKGRARDWIVAKYHLNASDTLDKDAKITGIKIKEGPVQVYGPGKMKLPYIISPSAPGGMNCAGNIPITILRGDGGYERNIHLVSHHTPEAEKYLKTGYKPVKIQQNTETLYFNPRLAEYTDQTCDRFCRLEIGDALKRVGEFMDNSAYKNKIRITAKRIEG